MDHGRANRMPSGVAKDRHLACRSYSCGPAMRIRCLCGAAKLQDKLRDVVNHPRDHCKETTISLVA